MKRNPNISGYIVNKNKITFDPKHSIYKEAVLKLITDAREYHSKCSKKTRTFNRKSLFISTLKQICGEFTETPIIINKVVIDACIKLHNAGKCDLVPKIMKEYKLYKMC